MNRQSGRLDSARSGNAQEHQNGTIQPHHISISKASDTYPNHQGEYAEVHFDVQSPGNRLSVPINALRFRPEGTMVAVVGPDNRLTLKKLTIGRDFGNSVEVLQGIEPQYAVVINPPDSLENGQQVILTGQNDKTTD